MDSGKIIYPDDNDLKKIKKPIEESVAECSKYESEIDQLRCELVEIEKRREFDRKVDRLKKSSAVTTIAAVLPSLIGVLGMGHFYLNRPLDGIGFLAGGIITMILGIFQGFNIITGLFSPLGGPFAGSSSQGFWLGPEGNVFWVPWASIIGIIYLGIFIGNIVSVRFWYRKYDTFVEEHAKLPWNNWGLKTLDSQKNR